MLLFAFFIFFGHSFSFAASAWGQDMVDQNTVIIRKEQSGAEFRVKPGATIRLELPALGGAGYAWYLDSLSTDHLQLVSEHTETIPGQGGTGAPVMAVWRFRTTKEGRGEIKLDYYRNWEGKEKSIDHFIVKIHITGGE
jgi:predicted secreted protein